MSYDERGALISLRTDINSREDLETGSRVVLNVLSKLTPYCFLYSVVDSYKLWLQSEKSEGGILVEISGEGGGEEGSGEGSGEAPGANSRDGDENDGGGAGTGEDGVAISFG